jgi:hypothetical protein
MLRFTSSISSELSDILDPFTEWFFAQPDQDLVLGPLDQQERRKGGLNIDTATDEQYLQHIVNKKQNHVGFPEVAWCTDMSQAHGQPWFPSEYGRRQQETNKELISYLGARNNAVFTYYPENGFMGWHNNWNASGYNILITYNSEENGGYFRYSDPITKEIVTLVDPKGWSCKVGYFGSRNEPEKIVYHCCGNTKKRLTLAYVVPHLEIWRSMIEDISGEDASDFN